MACRSVITITYDKDVKADVKMRLFTQAFTSKTQAVALQSELNAIAGGMKNASIGVVVDAADNAYASGTVVFSDHGTANDTVLINGVTFTCVNSGATGNQWNKGADATATALALKTAINASATALVTTTVLASVSSGTLTIRALYKGTMGNSVTIAKGVDGGSVMTVSGARLTGGSESTSSQSSSYSFGI